MALRLLGRRARAPRGLAAALGRRWINYGHDMHKVGVGLR